MEDRLDAREDGLGFVLAVPTLGLGAMYSTPTLALFFSHKRSGYPWVQV